MPYCRKARPKAGLFGPIATFAVILCSALSTTQSTGQTFTAVNLTKSTGGSARGTLVQGSDGNYYGVASEGGPYTSFPCFLGGCGTVFKLTPSGSVQVVHKFHGSDGYFSSTGLVMVTFSDLYGTTPSGGAYGDGTIFQMTRGGTLFTLHNFNGTDGSDISPDLVQAANGDLYGAASHGGAYGAGTIFKMTPGGTLTTLYNFCSLPNCQDGAYPNGGLVQAADGNFYGTTYDGGTDDAGTVFKIAPTGQLTTLHSFDITNGNSNNPTRLIEADNGNFYGVTSGGLNGSVFEITPQGQFRTLHEFIGTDGSLPLAPLVQATDGNLYGTTQNGGNGVGNIFQITLQGVVSTIHNFDGNDGAFPQSGLFQATDGNLYGAAYAGGTGACFPAPGSCGTLYRVSLGLDPFVRTVPISGNVGHCVKILGDNLSGATAVFFGGKSAAFTILSATELKTTVPKGATTGKVQVVTPNGTFKSDIAFRVF